MGRPRQGQIEYCTKCGKELYRPPSQRKRGRPFCSRQCHMAYLNAELNPYRMTPEVREKLRKARLGTGQQKTYVKQYGRHEHRIIAAQILNRPLRPGEVVHHLDGDKRNNSPHNLIVFSSQNEHAAWHAREKEILKRWIPEEVMPDDL